MGRKKILDSLLRPLGFGTYRLGDKDVQEQAFHEAALRFKKSIVADLARKEGYVVARGPFAGMKLPEIGAWSDYDVLSKIVGSYEAELFDTIIDAVSRKPDLIFNIGASEGYYAVGMKRLLPSAAVFTYDIDKNSFDALAYCSRVNEAEITRLDAFSFSDPLRDVGAKSDASVLFFADCEGFENEIATMPQMISRRSNFIVELHDLFVPGTTERLTEYFAPTHRVRLIEQSRRDTHSYPEIRALNDLTRQVVLDEFRAKEMQWLYAVPN